MTISSLAKEFGLASFDKAITKGFTAGQGNSIKAASSYLGDRIREDTVTAEDIDSFIEKSLDFLPESKRPAVLEFLLAKKGMLLINAGAFDQGLKLYDEALKVKETPSTWALKGTGLLQIERLDQAFEAFRKAFELREEFGVQKRSYLKDLITVWSSGALLRGLYGILEQNISEAQSGVNEYIDVSSQARADGLKALEMPLEVAETASAELRAAMDELKLMVKLFSIKNPFDRWREFSKEISSVWPDDVSAADAIREQRS